MTLHRLVLTTVGVGALTIAGLGCGGGGISIDNLPDDIKDAICQAQVDCGQWPDRATCEAAIDLGNIGQAQAGADEGRSSYDSGKAQDCINALADTISCEPFSDFDNGKEDGTDVCDDVFTGNVAIGGECYASEDCEGIAECETDCGEDECCAGTCVAGEAEPPPAAIGTTCGDGIACVATGWCNMGTCAELGGEGAECGGFSGCGAGLACDGIQSTGKCVRPSAEGASCDPEQGFGFLSCARSDNYCDSTDNTCKKKPGPGDACDVEIKDCVAYAECVNGICVQRPGTGEACVTDGNVECLGDLECVNSVCTGEAAPPICGPTT